jgi:hypothetical protein
VATKHPETKPETGSALHAGLGGGLVVAVAVLLIGASNPQIVAANTLEVGDNGYPTISAAVQAARPGDTVLIHAGTYREEVAIDAAITLDVFGDGDVWVDGQCLRNHGFWLWGSGATLRNIKVKNTIEAGVLLFAERPDQPQPSNITIDGMTIQDFDCRWTSEEPGSWGQYRAGIASWYGGPGMRVTNNLIQHRTSGDPHGSADGIWFKSRDLTPSGGGHYIAGNTIIGGWDGIGGEEEGSAHGTFDRDTIIENNTIRDCWDDGIQSEGGDQDVRIRNNDISGCGTGIAFAAPVTGPLYIEQNHIHDLSMGLYENLFCFKVGNTGNGTAYLTENVCDVASAAEASQGGADGIHQTDEGLSPIISRRNVFQVSGYVFILPESPLPPGTSFDEDCVSSTDPERFIKWSGNVYYTGLAELQSVGQEPNGRQTTDCSFLGTPTPLPSLTPPPRTTPGAAASNPTSAPQTAAAQPSSGPTPNPGSASSSDSSGGIGAPLIIVLGVLAGLILLGLGFVGGVRWSGGDRHAP